MVILVDKNTRVIVQGITGREGSFHTKMMLEYGTKIVAGVTPGRGGAEVHGVPVYNSVEEAVRFHPEANTSIVFVPARFAPDAVYEAIDAGIRLIVVITEHIPVHETIKFVNYAKARGAIVVGPNCPGVISPGKAKVGIMPGHVFSEGNVGIVSRSGTLSYEVAYQLTRAGIGQSTVVGVGGDPVVGLDLVEAALMLDKDPDTHAIVVIGEVGGDAEERLASLYGRGLIKKPLVAYVVGKTAPPGKRMGHAGAIISMGTGDVHSKIRAFMEVGVPVVETPTQVVNAVKSVLKR